MGEDVNSETHCWWAFALMAMKDERKTKKQLIEELEASRGEVTDLRGEVTDLREKVAGTDVSAVERQLAVERVQTAALDMRGTDDQRRVVASLRDARPRHRHN